ncbi:MAG: hypothetical protein MMC33_003804 [Icmadophila ericetorum]|nr:hypothetical protein [Icmadophila ericetorum]
MASTSGTSQFNIHTSQLDFENPLDAVNSYARIMHQHTKRQLESANLSARRRAPETVNAMSTLTTESSHDSTSSSNSVSSR